MAVFLRIYLHWQNQRRDKQQGTYVDPEDSRLEDSQSAVALENLDETDMENKRFRYVL
jgi:hypothetical protein